jgi:Malectin domain
VYKFLRIPAGFLLACLPAAAPTQQPICMNCARVFNVKLNSLLVLQNFDIDRSAGAIAAVVESFNTSVNNGTPWPSALLVCA